MKNKMEKCILCKNYNKETSNENWVVCSKLPLSVVISGTSEKCENYVAVGKG